MPERAATDEEVAARALVLIGAKSLTTFDDGTTESQAAAAIYEDVVTMLMTSSRWRFCAHQAELNQLSESPDSRWASAYQIPSDCLSVVSLALNSRSSPHKQSFDRYQDQLWTNDLQGQPLYLDYIRRVPTVEWPAYFTLPAIHLLASELAISVAQNEQLSDLHYKKYERFAATGRSTDAQGRTNSVLDVKRYESARRS